MSLAEPRARLAARQAALMKALAGTGSVPAGFDTDRLRVAAASLASKRQRQAAHAWPALARALGERFVPLFGAYAVAAPLPEQGGPLADGRAFAQTLACEDWTDAARLEMLAVDARFRTCARGILPRRGFFMAGAWLRQARRLVLALRLPWLGIHGLAVPLGFPRTAS